MERHLVVDDDNFVWWLYEDGTYSMVRTNPDASPIPFPVTVHIPAYLVSAEEE